jgi:hypothetical protein
VESVGLVLCDACGVLLLGGFPLSLMRAARQTMVARLADRAC